MKEKNMKTLVLYPQYGLANRLRAIASAKILAECAGRKLYVNWIPYHQCNVEWEDLFMNRLESYPLPLSAFRKGVDRYDDNNRVDEFYSDMPQSLISNISDVIAVSACCNFQPKEITLEAYTALKSHFYRNLQPVDSIQRSVKEVHERYFEGQAVVGVHIRRSDHLQHRRKDPRLISPTTLFIEAMERILKDNSDTKFFLATDDKEEETAMRRRFPRAVIVHEKEAVNRNTKKGIQDALVDWLLLSRTSRIIRSSTSSFSEEAAVVNMTKCESILKEEELSKIHYRILFRELVIPHYRLLRKEGFRKYFSYSYNYRRGQVTGWIKNRLSPPE